MKNRKSGYLHKPFREKATFTFKLKGYQIERELYYYVEYFLQERELDFILIFCNPETKLIKIEQK